MIVNHPITTRAKLDATPDRAVVIDADGDPWVRHRDPETMWGYARDYWTTDDMEGYYSTDGIVLPATLVYTPGQEDQ